MFSKSDIEKYFIAEKQESLLFMIVGVVAIVLAVFLFLYLKTSVVKGILIPLIVVGCIEVAVGYTVFRKCDLQRTNMTYAFDLNPNMLRNEEIPRMIAVMRSFKMLRAIEISLFLIGLVLVFSFRTSDVFSFWYGFGIALTIQAFFALALDFFAERRGDIYLEGLKDYLK